MRRTEAEDAELRERGAALLEAGMSRRAVERELRVGHPWMSKNLPHEAAPPAGPEIARLHALGVPVPEIARRVGVVERTVYRHVGSDQRFLIPQEKIARAIELCDDGVPVPMIAMDTRLEIHQVRNVLRRNGRRAESTWRQVRVTITNNPTLRALHEEIMSLA